MEVIRSIVVPLLGEAELSQFVELARVGVIDVVMCCADVPICEINGDTDLAIRSYSNSATDGIDSFGYLLSIVEINPGRRNVAD